MNKTAHRLITAMLSLLMAIAVVAAPVLTPAAHNPYMASAATSFKDISGHWARSYIQKAVSLGLVNGYYDGTFRPENNVTRAEFTKMLNTTLGNNGIVDVDFTDVAPEQWFCADVCKGVAAAFVNGYGDGSFAPDNTITRQEAAVILARIIPAAESGKSVEAYQDAGEIAEWAATSMEKIVGKAYMTGADKKLMPTAPLTRGQAAKIIVELAEGENIIKNNQTIVKDDITIKDAIYANQISVGSQVAGGTATFDNSVILGNVNVLGGGSEEGKGVLLKNSRAAKLTVARSGNTVRVSAIGESTIVNTWITESALLQEDSAVAVRGDFGKGFVNVSMNRKSDLDLNGNIELLNFLESKCDARIRNGFTVKNLVIDKDASRCNIVLDEGSSSGTVEVRGDYTVLEGKGSIEELNVYANALTYQSTPKKMTVDNTVEVLPVQYVDPSEALRITADPSDQETGVPVSGSLKLTFSSSVRANDGSAGRVLTDAQAESLIQLKQGTSSGPNVPFTAKVSGNGTIVTVTPDESLAYGTVYYLKIGREDLTDEYDHTNALFLSSFTTENRKTIPVPAPVIQPETEASGASAVANS